MLGARPRDAARTIASTWVGERVIVIAFGSRSGMRSIFAYSDDRLHRCFSVDCLHRSRRRRRSTRTRTGWIASSAAMTVTVTLPDGNAAGAAPTAPPAPTPPPRSAPASRAPRSRSRSATPRPARRRELRDLSRPLPDGARPLDPHQDERRRRARADPPRRRARARRRPCSSSIPGVKISIGPPIENGFYYDFEFPDGVSVSEADFPAIEERDARARQGRRAVRAPRRDARRGARALRGRGPGLQGRADRRPRRARRRTGTRCATRASRSTRTARSPTSAAARTRRAPRRVGAFKLQSVAGAYWRGDSEPHDAHAHLRHRVLHQGRAGRAPASGSSRPAPATTASSGRELGLFTFSEVSPGAAFWLPARHRPCATRCVARLARDGRARAATPRSRRRSSTTPSCGRPPATGTSTARTCSSLDVEDREMALKPMNCPGHCAAVRACRRHSYRDLPVRYSEPGLLHRNEASRHAARAAARAPLRPGRRAHLLHRGAGPGGGRAAAWSWPSPPTRCSTSTCSLELSTRPERADRRRRDVGPRRGRARRRARRAGPRLRAQRGRRRLLRPEDRHAHDRLARALVAARNGAARLHHARALRAHLHRRRQRRAHAR